MFLRISVVQMQQFDEAPHINTCSILNKRFVKQKSQTVVPASSLGSITIRNSVFMENEASLIGGGIHIDQQTQLSIVDSQC